MVVYEGKHRPVVQVDQDMMTPEFQLELLEGQITAIISRRLMRQFDIQVLEAAVTTTFLLATELSVIPFW